MVISADKVKEAQKQITNFFSRNRKNTTLKVNWSLDAEKVLSEFKGLSVSECIIDFAKEEMKNNLLLKEFEDYLEKDTKYYSYNKDESDNDDLNLEFPVFH